LVEVELVDGVGLHHARVGRGTGSAQLTVLEDVGSLFAGRDVGSVEELAELILGEFKGSNRVRCLVNEVQDRICV
jgi:hypothetical protein